MANTDLQLNTTITLKDEFSSQMGGFASSVGRLHGMLESLNTTMNKITHIASTPLNNNFSNGLASIGRSAHRANIELNILNNTLTRTVGLASRMPSGSVTATAGASGGGTRGLGAIRGYRGILGSVTRALSTVNANFFRGLGLVNAGFLRGLGSIFSVALRGLGGTGLRGLGTTGGGGLPSSNSPRAFGGFGDFLKNNLVTSLVGAFGSMAVLKQAQKLFEDATKHSSMNSRLANLDYVAVNKEISIEGLRDKIFGAAMRSTSNYLDFADFVAKVGASAGDAFGSHSELIQFAEQLNKIFTVSGVDSAGKASATLQLSQALGSGQLQGDEFRSISESAPILLDLISKSLGKTRAEVKQLASQGEITAGVIKKAVFDNMDMINDRFKKMSYSWQDVTIMINNYTAHAFQGVYQKISAIFSRERIQKLLNKITPIVYNLADMIERMIDKLTPTIDWVIDNFDSLFNGISSLTVLLGSIIGIITTINILMATGPIGIIAVILVSLEIMIQQLNKINGTTYNLFNFIWAGLVFTWEYIMNIFKLIAKFTAIYTGYFIIAILNVGKFLNRIIKVTIELFRLAWVGIKWIFSSGINYLFKSINWLCEKTVQGLTLVAKSFLDPLINGLNMLIDLSNKISGTKFDKIELSLNPDKNGAIKFFSNEQEKNQNSINRNNAILGNEAIDIVVGTINNVDGSERKLNSSINTVKQLAEGTANNIQFNDPLKKTVKAFNDSVDLFNFSKSNSKMLNLDKLGTGFDKSSVLNDIKKNTDDIRNNSDFSKYLRELADRNTINHFTTPTYNINFDNQNTINNDSDVNDIVTTFSDKLREALTNARQGVYQSYGGAYA